MTLFPFFTYHCSHHQAVVVGPRRLPTAPPALPHYLPTYPTPYLWIRRAAHMGSTIATHACSRRLPAPCLLLYHAGVFGVNPWGDIYGVTGVAAAFGVAAATARRHILYRATGGGGVTLNAPSGGRLGGRVLTSRQQAARLANRDGWAAW